MSRLKTNDIPLSGLLTMQQVIEFGSAEMSDLYFKALDSFEKNLISKSYLENLETDFEKRLEVNNGFVDEISKEITRRMKTVFPKATLNRDLIKYQNSYKKELIDYKKMYSTGSDEAEAVKNPTNPPVFKISKEKKK